jgi:hypothetical protein
MTESDPAYGARTPDWAATTAARQPAAKAGPSIHERAGLTVDEGAAALRLRH